MIEYIKREDALKTLIEAIHNDGFAGESNIERHDLREDEIEDAIRSIPAADVEPVVRGEWIGESGEECSVCGARSKWFYDRFCPNCGAHMERSGSGE